MPGIALVGQAGIAGGNGTSPATINYASTGGNTLIVTGHLFDNNSGEFVAPTSITDTAGNTWQVSVSSAQAALTVQDPPLCSITDPVDGGSAHVANFVAWCVGAAAVTSVTIAWEGGVSTWRRMNLSEFSGVAQFDNSWAGGSTSNSSSVTSGPVTVNVSGELVVGAFDFGGGGAMSPPSGWTQFTGAGSVGDNAYIINPATGSLSPVWTDTVANPWAGALAVFSPVVLGYVLPEFIFGYVSGTGKLSDSKNPTTVNSLNATSTVNQILGEVIGVDYSELY